MYKFALDKKYLRCQKEKITVFKDNTPKSIGERFVYTLDWTIHNWLKERNIVFWLHIGQQKYIVFERKSDAAYFKMYWSHVCTSTI